MTDLARLRKQAEEDLMLAQDRSTRGWYPDLSKRIVREAQVVLSLADENERLREALQDARPFVHSVFCEARADGQTWRMETAEPILRRLDDLLAGLASEESAE